MGTLQTLTPARRIPRLMLLMLLLGILLALAVWIDDTRAMLEMVLERARSSPELLVGAAVLYALCLAIPFMPGIELGWLMMLMFGKPGILVAWLATLAGLGIAFMVGRLLRRQLKPPAWIAARIPSVEELDEHYDRTVGRTRLGRYLGRFQGAFPYLTLAVLLNLPGNMLIGGGGGISMASAFSDRIELRSFLLTCALATAPIPLLVWFGVINVGHLLQIKP